MSDAGMPLPGAKFAGRVLLATASFNRSHVDELERGFIRGVGIDEAEHAQRIVTVRVPGALELAQALLLRAQTGRFSVLAALGCVIRGETMHYEIVCRTSADSLARLTERLDVPVINGILTCESEQQAAARAETKGAEFGRSASIMAALLENG